MRPDPKLYCLSDGLKALRSRFARHDCLVIEGRGMAMLVEEIDMLREAALAQAHEVSKLRSNAQARAEAEHVEAVLEAVHRAGSNVRLFPSRFELQPDAAPPRGAA
jgi:hypothetical protein